MSRAIDLLITYRVIKMLVTPFDNTDAYKLGIIDKNGKVLRKAKTLKTPKEKDAYTLLHRFVFNLKRLINIVPGGKSKLGTYAAALGLLLRENKDINMVELEKISNVLPAKAATIAPTIITEEMAFVTDIKGVCKEGVTLHTT